MTCQCIFTIHVVVAWRSTLATLMSTQVDLAVSLITYNRRRALSLSLTLSVVIAFIYRLWEIGFAPSSVARSIFSFVTRRVAIDVHSARDISSPGNGACKFICKAGATKTASSGITVVRSELRRLLPSKRVPIPPPIPPTLLLQILTKIATMKHPMHRSMLMDMIPSISIIFLP